MVIIVAVSLFTVMIVIKSNEEIKIRDLNIIANDLFYTFDESEESLHMKVMSYANKTGLDFAFVTHAGEVVAHTKREPLYNGQFGLFTLNKFDYYVLPVEGHEKYARLIIFAKSPKIISQSQDTMRYLFGIWLLLMVGGYGVGFWFLIKRNRFKTQLAYMIPSDKDKILATSVQHDLFRYILKKVSDYEDDLKKQSYQQSVENTKQDERMRNMMHDMKTPIAAILAFMEAYHDGLYAPEHLPKKMQLIDRNVNHLIHLTNQYDAYLKYASSEHKINMRRVHMNKLMNETVVGIERDYAQQGRKVQLVLYYAEAFVVCELGEIHKVLNILVENAHKYSDISKPIVIMVSHDDQFLNIAIKDYGVGISVENQMQVFDPFVKVDRSRKASKQSYGIGLYIAKQIAFQHGGDIKLESELGKGTTFTLMLPLLGEDHVPSSETIE